MEENDGSRYLEHPLIRSKAIEFRLYQKQISDIASEKNTLVILPTALGKTIISVIVAANVLFQYRDAKVLIMAPTRPLVMQHRDAFFRFLKLREKDVCILTGDTPPSRRKSLWRGGARLFFSTPQVVRNDLRSGRLDLWGFGLVVFDECHRAVKRYAYTDIASLYFSQAKYPLILGMTASPGSELERVLRVCENLYIEQVEYRTEEDPDVKPYIQSIKIEWMMVKLPEAYLAARAQIRSILDKRLRWLKSWGIVRNNPPFVFRRELIEAGHELRYNVEESIEEERGRFFVAIINQSVALTLHHMLELLETQGMYSLSSFLKKVEIEKESKRSYAIIAKDQRFVALRDILDRSHCEHPKAELLLDIVGEQISNRPNSRMLVFTQYRDTASHLVDLLSKIPQIKVDRFVGQTFKLADAGLTQEEQTEMIRKLRVGELNVLVATSIAEEGLDIPAVDHVIFYEPIPNEIRHIQRRGRTGRSSAGKVTILATEGTMDVAYLRISRRRAEKMKRIAASVNIKLRDIVRNTPRPPPNPLTLPKLRSIEGKQETEGSDEIVILDDEEEIFIIDDNEPRIVAEMTGKELYTKILERGIAGISKERLAFETERNGISSTTLRATLEKFVKDGLIIESATGRYLTTSSLNSTGKTHEIMVEKIQRGHAIVKLDSVLSAILTPEDYEGPRNLIKKNSRFKASSKLYSFRGILYIRVNEILEIMK